MRKLKLAIWLSTFGTTSDTRPPQPVVRKLKFFLSLLSYWCWAWGRERDKKKDIKRDIYREREKENINLLLLAGRSLSSDRVQHYNKWQDNANCRRVPGQVQVSARTSLGECQHHFKETSSTSKIKRQKLSSARQWVWLQVKCKTRA